MQKNLLKDTPAYQFGVRPAVQCRDMSSVMVPDVVKSMDRMFDTANLYDFGTNQTTKSSLGLNYEPYCGDPERDAVVFYMMNHVVSIARQGMHPYESFGDRLPLIEEYHRQLGFRASRMFFYMLLICTRESRHEKKSKDESMWVGFSEKYGSEIMKLHASIKGKGSDAAADRFRNNPPNCQLGKYTEFLAEVFYKGSYSHGFGGKAWGKVADVLNEYVHGKITAEMMLDTSFTLCHNNGPIFNKGMLFGGYSHEIYRILDVQRSGQIPQFVANKETKWAKDPVVKELFDMSVSIMGPKGLTGHVDWYMVENLGAMKKYPEEKQKQAQLYGVPGNVIQKDAVTEPDDSGFKWKSAEKAKPKDHLEIMPGVFVAKCKERPA